VREDGGDITAIHCQKIFLECVLGKVGGRYLDFSRRLSLRGRGQKS